MEVLSILESELGASVVFVHAGLDEIKAAILSRIKIKTIFGSLEEPDYSNFQTIHQTAEHRLIDPKVLSHLPDIPSIPDLVDLILFHGISHQASDIHLDPGPFHCIFVCELMGCCIFSNNFH